MDREHHQQPGMKSGSCSNPYDRYPGSLIHAPCHFPTLILVLPSTKQLDVAGFGGIEQAEDTCGAQ